jgi:hypothetical protein
MEFKVHAPVERGMYAFNKLRAGDFILFVKEMPDYYMFLEFPGNTTLLLSRYDFNQSISTNILEFAETLPTSVFEETIQYVEKHEKKCLMS